MQGGQSTCSNAACPSVDVWPLAAAAADLPCPSRPRSDALALRIFCLLPNCLAADRPAGRWSMDRWASFVSVRLRSLTERLNVGGGCMVATIAFSFSPAPAQAAEYSCVSL